MNECMIASDEIKNFCAVAKKFVKRNSLQILDNILIEDGVMAITNLGITLRKRIDGLTLPDCLVDFKRLSDIVSKLKNQPILLSVEGSQMKIVVEKSTLRLPILFDDDTFPKIVTEVTKDVKVEQIGSISAEAALRAKKAIVFASTDELRPVMTTVLLEDKKIVATDGNKILFEDCDGVSVSESIMVLPTVLNMLSGKNAVDVTKLTTGNGDGCISYLFKTDNGYKITYRAIEGKFPAWRMVLPNHYEPALLTVTMYRRTLINTIESAMLAIRKGCVVAFNFDGEAKTITVSSQSIGEDTAFSDKLDADSCEGDSLRIGFNSLIMLSCLKHNDSEPMVTVSFKKAVNVDCQCALIDDSMIVMPVSI